MGAAAALTPPGGALAQASRSASSSSATRRSSGVVTLRFSGRRRVDQHLAARLLDQHRVVGRGGDPLRVGVQRVAQGLGPEHLGRLRRPEVIAAHRLGDGRAAPGDVPPGGRGSRARFTVSVSGAAAITPAASGRERRAWRPARRSAPPVTSGRAASWTATSSASTRSRAAATDSRAVLPAGHRRRHPPCAELRLDARRGSGDDHAPTASARANASSDHSTSGRPASSTKAFGPPAPRSLTRSRRPR